MSGILIVFGMLLLGYTTAQEWWPGLLPATVIVLVFGRIAVGAKRTETEAGPQGVKEKTDLEFEEAPTRQLAPESRSSSDVLVPRRQPEGTGPGPG